MLNGEAVARQLELAALTPVRKGVPSIALAASRAGGLGVLDLEHAADVEEAVASVRALALYPAQVFGVKLDGRAVELHGVLAADLPDNVGTVILTAGSLEALLDPVAALRRRHVRTLMTVCSVEDAELAEALGVDGVIAKGSEGGGWVGEETTFVLLQRLLARSRCPVWAQGGIGTHTIAACYAAGAAGVILDSQLALLRESALPEDVRAAVARMDGSETVSVGGELGAACRLYARPRLRALDELVELQSALDDGRPRPEALVAWRAAVRARIGWGAPERHVWPLGQDAAFASGFARRYRTVPAALAGLREAAREGCRAAQRLRPLAEGAPLAESHGTRYPILQGPMTRVSDTAAFAESVAAAGALPFLALALLRGEELRSLLDETKRRLGDRPWGAGILGFVPLELRQEQMQAIEAVRPPYALIAGGRPDQALALEASGIPTYLHVPSPGLLSMFLDGGAHRFVFEGRECGGHVGPRSSFVLWELMIDVLLDKVSAGPEAGRYHAVFAGGIHDDRSAAMVATLAAPLAERGIRVGVLLGTAYLFTQEAVASGAIVKTFQEQAIGCERTILLESGPGHATRCVDTEFGGAFKREKRRLGSESGLSPDEVRNALEELNLGRLRMASKGIARNPKHRGAARAPRFVELDPAEQRAQGMFMIGQVAALRDRVCTMPELHRSVSDGGTARLVGLELEPAAARGRRAGRPADVAIVGMATLLPKAPALDRFWRNILAKADAITEIPPERWDWRRYYDPDPSAPDKVYSKWGGFIDAVPFDPMTYGMPPNSLRSIEPLQLLTLEVVRAALADAGYADRPFPRERTGVMLGVGGGSGELGQQYAVRSNLPMYTGDLPAVLKQLPEWTEDSFAGILLNVAAGRVANRFDLGGVNCTVDAACASSLAAVYLAVRELEAGTADMMLVGGADTVQNPFAYLCFSKTHALSPRGRCRAFDADADGIVISEGFAVLVLKRLEDAERDGDRIYAVIKSVAGSSDGRDRGLTAPRPEGQIRALERAYTAAGFGPETIGLIEAHGTGTVAGDRAEVESLTRVFAGAGATPASCAIGSVKSMIGHTKCTAGVAGLVKVALALHHQVLPPTLNIEQPNPEAFAPGSPFYVNTESRPWLARADGTPRRAGVSAFGFGGTNFHVTVEEYPDGDPSATVAEWTSELFVWTGGEGREVAGALDALERELAAGARPALRDLACSVWRRTRERRTAQSATLAIVATSLDDLRQKAATAREALATERPSLEDPRGIYFTRAPLGREGRVAFLFPGQGSQHVDMLRELALHFAEVRAAFARADRVLAGRFPEPLSAYVFPPPTFGEAGARARQEALTRTNVAQPALGAADLGLLALLRALGVTPELVGGHSYGEYVALCAAGVMDEDTLFALSEARGRAIIDTAGDDLGTMAAVAADRVATEAALVGLEDVWIANLNSPTQTMISGTRPGIDEAIRRLVERGVQAQPISVACAFHSPLVARARDTLAARVAAAALQPPRIEVFSNTTATAYPSDAAAIAALLAAQLVEPVRFAEEIEALYRAGARLFVEVGPKSVLTGLVQQTLGTRAHLAVAPGAAGRPGLTSLQLALAQLAAHGVALDLDRLFEGRQMRQLDLDNLAAVSREAPLPPTAWMVHGGRAWPAREPVPAPPTPVALPALVAAAPAPPPASVVVPGLPVTTPSGSLEQAAPQAAAGQPGAAEVVVQFQRLMSQFLETQRKVMLAYLQGSSGAPAPPPALEAAAPAPAPSSATPAQAPPLPALAPSAGNGGPQSDGTPSRPVEIPVPAPAAAAGFNRERLTQGLLGIVSERTGYPPEMLELDLNMEADLGIDSIKRVEIYGAFQRAHLPGRAQQLMERLAGVKTLRQVVDVALEAGRGPAEPVEAATTVPTAEPAATPGAPVEVPRWLLAAVDAPLADLPPLPVTERPLIITDDLAGVAAAVAAELRRQGASVVVVRHGATLERIDAHTYAAGLTDLAGVTALVDTIRREHGAPAGLIHLAPLRARLPLDALDLAGWHADLALDVKSIFYFVRVLDGDFKRAAESSDGVVLAATAMGGSFASEGASAAFPASHGGVAGLLKTLALEWPGVRCKVVDLEPDQLPAGKAEHVLRELAAADGKVEVGYRRGRRLALRPRPAAFARAAPAGLAPDGSWVWLVTGGARGITAEVACELASRYRPTLVLTGRSAFPAPEEAPGTAALTGQGLKRALIEQMRAGGRPPEPARIEAACARLLHDREIRQNVAAMRSAGATVHYHAVDVRDERAFGALLEELYARHGRLDGVIHGAGVIEDKLLEDKAVDSFDRVFDTKLDGAWVLLRKLSPNSTRILVFFSSVAARFGNRGQGDYAAANEVLNKLAVQLDHAWPGRVVALGWGPWGKTGMVSAEIERQFLERGVQIIAPADGRRVFLDELRLGAKGESEVILGGGSWESAPPTRARRDHAELPMLNGDALSVGKSGALELVRRLDPSYDVYLRDHQIDGKPVFPAAMAMELMAEVVQRGWPEWRVTGVRSLRVLRGIVLDDGPKMLHVTARPQQQQPAPPDEFAPGGLAIDVEILETRDSTPVSYRATVELADRIPAAAGGRAPRLDNMRPFPMPAREAYDRWLFHGPLFQGISDIEGMNDQWISAVLRPSDPERLIPSARGAWVIDPVLIDSAFQLAILWVRAHHDVTPLPSRLGAYRALGLPTGAPVQCHLRAQASMGGSILNTSVVFVEGDGRVLGVLEDMEFTCSKALNRLGGSAAGSSNRG